MFRRLDDGRYEFRLQQEKANEVYLVVDFPAYEQTRIPMTRSRSGEWVCRVSLPDGAYFFRYWVDGHWCLDEAPHECDAAAFMTSSVMVKSQTSPEWAYVG